MSAYCNGGALGFKCKFHLVKSIKFTKGVEAAS